jgi:predicted nucleotide-binding protein (sugar kinase/HSP70/actin superfamily)
MYLNNKVRSYEKNKGDSQKLVDKWVNEIRHQYDSKKGVTYFQMKKNLKNIAKDFDSVSLTDQIKPRVGIVGEIYIKYASLGNNGLEDFLISEGAEVKVPGLLGFMFYSLYDTIYDRFYYKTPYIGTLKTKVAIKYMVQREKLIIKAIKKYTKFTPMNEFSKTKDYSNGILSHGVKMGEGWLLTAEMEELVDEGYTNVICAQPFGCLPNHICGKGVMKAIKKRHPQANFVAIDYDPSQTKVNQENRIKLMLSIARESLDDKQIL